MSRWFAGCVAVAVVGCVAVAARGETVEEVRKKIAAASDKLKSYSAKMEMVTEMKQSGFSMVNRMVGTMEMLRTGDQMLMRNESSGSTETTMGGNTTKQETTSLIVNDGSYTYTLSDTGGMKTAFKTKSDASDKDPLGRWRAIGGLKVLQDESVDGEAVWVIEARPETGAAQGRSVLYFQKDTGQMIKMVAYSPDDKPMTTMTYSDIKINPSISADRFVFHAPPGVTVQEMP